MKTSLIMKKHLSKNKLHEAKMIVSVANVIPELLPKELFVALTPQQQERAKDVVRGLVDYLNMFYKRYNLGASVQNSSIKYKMYLKEQKLIENAKREINRMLMERSKFKIYHNSFRELLIEVEDYVESLGYTLDEYDWESQVVFGGSSGRARPSVGVTKSFTIGLFKNGIPQSKALHFQAYGMEDSYELNMYIR